MSRFLLVVLFSMLSACASQSDLPNWAPVDPSRFPLQISSIAFPSGYAVGPTSGVTLPNGSWTIRYPAGGEVMAISPAANQIDLSPLSCFSGSAGVQPCYMKLSHVRGQMPVCELVIGTLPDQTSGSFIVSVTCPDLWTGSS